MDAHTKNIFDFKEIDKRNSIIDNTIKKLKEDFVGIDEQIDNIMNNVRAWYLFPQLQNTPLIINLWGMTGVGKTSLIKSIVKYLDLEKDLVYFNFAQINEMSSFEVEDHIEKELENENPRRVFVYDEFQYAATLNGAGEEKDKACGLKPFWELLDTGILHKRFSFSYFKTVKRVFAALYKICLYTPIELENGKWVNYKKCMAPFSQTEIAQFHKIFNFPYDSIDDKKGCAVTDCNGTCADEEYEGYDNRRHITKYKSEEGYNLIQGRIYVFEDNDFILRHDDLIEIISVYAHIGKKICDDFNFMENLKKMSFDELFFFIENVYNDASRGYDLIFDKSIIFVLGNLDEAYQMSFNTNPDMSPDQFYKLSKKITVVDIKKALQRRFRNEQIARLGNIHIIYPAFSSDTFKQIISLTLTRYMKEAKEMCGYDLMFEKSLERTIYKEAVFPTHGARPIFSTIHEMVKTKLPLIINNIYNDNLTEKTHSINCGFERKYFIATIFDTNKKFLARYKFKEELRVDSLRKSTKDDVQSLVAVHESGHFVMYCKLYDELPEKICSKTVDSTMGGFVMMNDDSEAEIMSVTEVKNRIKLSLGGYVAEEIIFGKDKMSNGASLDLIRATRLASSFVRKWGMSDLKYVTTYGNSPESTCKYEIINEDNQDYINKKIKTLVDNCYIDAYRTINNEEWLKMLKESAKYLSSHSVMPKKKMKEIYYKIRNNVKSDIDKNYYNNIVNNF